jgi:hypothetical protein
VYFKDQLDRGAKGRSLGRVEVQAVDRESAERLGRESARLRLDVLAFCESLVSPPPVGIPSIDEPEREAIALAIENEGGFHLPGGSTRRATDVTALLKHPKNGRLNKRVSKMLSSGPANATAKRLLSAMSWAGRAAGLIRPEEQLLAYLIALESLILGKSEGELTFRLRQRCARLLGRTPTARKWLADRVKSVYNLRSAIVHSGVRDVTEADVGLARELALRAIVGVLIARRPKGVELEDWLETKTYS